MLLRGALILLLSLVCVAAVAAQELITAVRVEGNQRIEESTILLQLDSEPGAVLSVQSVEHDIKEIYRTGFFEEVSAERRLTEKGVELIFLVKEKPAIRELLVEGNEEVDSDKFLEKLDLTERRFLDRRKIEHGIEAVKDYYQSKGFYGTEIEYRVDELDESQVDVVFEVNEPEKQVIREVVFEGNSDFEDGELEDVVETATYNWWVSWALGTGILKQEDLEQDVQKLSHFYLTQGHVDVQVSEPVVEEVKDGLRVTFKISEGEIFKFGEIGAQGTLLEDSEKRTLEGIKSQSGELFNVDSMRGDTFVVSEKFTDIGYAFVNVDPMTDIDRKNKVVNINYMVDKGALIRINRILISGNEKTNDNVIRRSLKIQERQLFSSSKIRRSQELIQRLGYFDEVTITPEPSARKDEVDMAVSVREGSTGSFTAGAGISSGDGLIISSRISENNLFGTGNSLTLNVNLGTTRENLVLSYDDPRINDTYWSGGVDLLSVDSEFDDFDRTQKGGAVRFGYPLWFLGPEYLDDVRFSFSYDLLRVNIRDVSENASSLVQEQAGKTTSSSVTPRITRNTIDNPMSPSKGSRQVVSFELAGLGGDQEFWLGQASNSFYYPMWDSPVGLFVFSQRSRFGWGETYNGEDFPLFRRFFPGGINSVRGFESRELGPEDEEGSKYGGNKQLVFNFEVIFPLLDAMGFNGVVFYDIGNAFDDDESMNFSDLRQAVGWGIRWRSPIAPIRVEIGYPLDRKEGEKAVVTNFTFGAPL